jgi:hypothetical protein
VKGGDEGVVGVVHPSTVGSVLGRVGEHAHTVAGVLGHNHVSDLSHKLRSVGETAIIH